MQHAGSERMSTIQQIACFCNRNEQRVANCVQRLMATSVRLALAHPACARASAGVSLLPVPE